MPKPHQSFLKFPSIFTSENKLPRVRKISLEDIKMYLLLKNISFFCGTNPRVKSPSWAMGLTLINVFRCFRILGYFVFEIFQVKEQIVKLFRWVISSFALCQKYFLAAFVTRYIVRWWHNCQYKTFCQTVVIAANKGTGIWNMSILPKKKHELWFSNGRVKYGHPH